MAGSTEFRFMMEMFYFDKHLLEQVLEAIMNQEVTGFLCYLRSSTLLATFHLYFHREF